MLAGAFAAVRYVIVLFGFRMFDIIPVARQTVIEQMREGMLMLDAKQRIVDLNPAAEQILGLAAVRLRGRHLSEALRGVAELEHGLDEALSGRAEILIGPHELGARTGFAAQTDVLTALRGYLRHYSDNCGIEAVLSDPPGLDAQPHAIAP